MPQPIGRMLNKEWKVHALHALYRKNGKWYHHLRRFPGALFDECGYVVFETKEIYEECTGLHHGVELNVPKGIQNIAGYVRVRGRD